MLDITRSRQGIVDDTDVRQMWHGGGERLPVPVLPEPQYAQPVEAATANCNAGQKKMLASLARRVISTFPAALFSWQAVVLGGQLLCCSAGIVLTVVSGGAAPLLILAGIGLAIAIADIACLIHHQRHGLPMEHDSIANAVYFIARCFFEQQKSQDLGSSVSLGARALLTVVVVGQPFWCTTLGLNVPIFRQISIASYSALAFMRYGATGLPVTGLQVSVPFFRLLARLFPNEDVNGATR
ncbi:pathogenicity island 2 effector protein SseG [Yersinia aldovae]|uniref:Pathogenicity island 2 effector protein SseG n=1 Tax=Yersinia aldovae TaxID=29483 RepID=A0ABM9SXN7_YERAL|nr:pathogenicity island 2 effector protein SseG [Yersinia aldovae]CNL65719.1 pathogenicity island 2 effector protein SseG [Yersinia aldovae]